jgi:hypothetical protein
LEVFIVVIWLANCADNSPPARQCLVFFIVDTPQFVALLKKRGHTACQIFTPAHMAEIQIRENPCAQAREPPPGIDSAIVLSGTIPVMQAPPPEWLTILAAYVVTASAPFVGTALFLSIGTWLIPSLAYRRMVAAFAFLALIHLGLVSLTAYELRSELPLLGIHAQLLLLSTILSPIAPLVAL